jgi:flavin-binding protein dodecin
VEVDMKPPKSSKGDETRDAGVRGAPTGRDGAIDYALRLGASEEGAADHVYRVIELVGTSEESIEDAIRSAIGRAHKTLRNLRWFEVVRTSGHVDAGMVRHFQVTLKVGFTMEEPG